MTEKNTEKKKEENKEKAENKISENHQKQFDELCCKNKELVCDLQRLQAEFENYKKRIEKEKAEYKAYAEKEFITKLLPILDSFELALPSKQDSENFRKGIELIYSQLYTLLEKEGLKPIRSTGEKLDPYKHEVLMQEISEKEDNTIIEEFSKGYFFKDSVLRTSKVKISKKKS